MGCSASKDGEVTTHKKYHHSHAPSIIQIKGNDGHKHDAEHHTHATGKGQDQVFLNSKNAHEAERQSPRLSTPRLSQVHHGLVVEGPNPHNTSAQHLEVPAEWKY